MATTLSLALDVARSALSKAKAKAEAANVEAARIQMEVTGLEYALARDAGTSRAGGGVHTEAHPSGMNRTDAVMQVLTQAAHPLSRKEIAERVFELRSDVTDTPRAIGGSLAYLAGDEKRLASSVGRDSWIASPTAAPEPPSSPPALTPSVIADNGDIDPDDIPF